MLDNERDATPPVDTAAADAVSGAVRNCAANDNTIRSEDDVNGRCDVRGEAGLPADQSATGTTSDGQDRSPESDQAESEAEGDESGSDDDEASFTIPDDLYPVFFPRWALEETPRAKAYCALYDHVSLTIQPQDILDEMDAADITEHFWRSREIANSIDNIIKAARRDALATILAPMAHHNLHTALEWADDYFSGDPDKRKAIESLLRAHGMGPAAITAQAVMQRAPVLQILNRITTSIGIHRHDILAAHATRREARKAKSSKRRRVAA